MEVVDGGVIERAVARYVERVATVVVAVVEVLVNRKLKLVAVVVAVVGYAATRHIEEAVLASVGQEVLVVRCAPRSGSYQTTHASGSRRLDVDRTAVSEGLLAVSKRLHQLPQRRFWECPRESLGEGWHGLREH